jgi:hypothetical protein
MSGKIRHNPQPKKKKGSSWKEKHSQVIIAEK